MRRLLALCLALPTAFGLTPDPSTAQSIAVSGSPFEISCPQAGANMPVTIYVVVNLPTLACGGITGAEFRVHGIPSSWFFVQSEPGIPEIGNPLDEGVRMTHSCRTSDSDFLSVLTLRFFATSSVSNHPVTVIAHSMPSVPQFTCPIIRLCDAPVFTAICATGFETHINSICSCHGGCGSSCQPVALERSTWSQVKQLFGG